MLQLADVDPVSVQVVNNPSLASAKTDVETLPADAGCAPSNKNPKAQTTDAKSFLVIENLLKLAALHRPFPGYEIDGL
jgi:hypothetical protein